METMSDLKLTNITEVCRICLVTNSNMVYIFEPNNKLKIVEKIYSCFNEVINPDDRFPQNICISCIEELFISVKFKEKCLHSRDVLNQLLEENNFIKKENDYHSNSDSKDSGPLTKAIEEVDCLDSKLINRTSNNRKKILYSNTHSRLTVKKKKNDNKVKIRKPQVSCDEKLTDNILDEDSEIITIMPDINIQSVNVFKCETCNIVFHDKCSSEIHAKIHSGDGGYKCDKCPETFDSNSAIKMHNKDVHNSDKQVCPECGKSFASRESLKKHLVIHSAVKPHECSICKKRFTTKTYLNEHIARHKGDKKFICEVCDAKFVSHVNLKRHRIVHGIQNRNYKKHHCTHCDFKAINRVDLVRHIRTHTGEKPFQCPHDGCQSAFTSNGSLKLHLRLHTGEKPYECSECSMKFSRQDKYKNHMLKKHDIITVNSSDRSKLIIKELNQNN